MAYSTNSLERAQLCATHLHAIEDLLTQASEGSQALTMVNPNHLSLLLRGILEDLDGALESLEQQAHKPHLRTV